MTYRELHIVSGPASWCQGVRVVDKVGKMENSGEKSGLLWGISGGWAAGSSAFGQDFVTAVKRVYLHWQVG